MFADRYGLTLKEFENGDEPVFPKKIKRTTYQKWLKWIQKNVIDIHPPEIESWPLFFVGCIVFCCFFWVVNFFEQESIKRAIARRERDERKEKRKQEKREKERAKRHARGEYSDDEDEEETNPDKED